MLTFIDGKSGYSSDSENASQPQKIEARGDKLMDRLSLCLDRMDNILSQSLGISRKVGANRDSHLGDDEANPSRDLEEMIAALETVSASVEATLRGVVKVL